MTAAQKSKMEKSLPLRDIHWHNLPGRGIRTRTIDIPMQQPPISRQPAFPRDISSLNVSRAGLPKKARHNWKGKSKDKSYSISNHFTFLPSPASPSLDPNWSPNLQFLQPGHVDGRSQAPRPAELLETCANGRSFAAALIDAEAWFTMVARQLESRALLCKQYRDALKDLNDSLRDIERNRPLGNQSMQSCIHVPDANIAKLFEGSQEYESDNDDDIRIICESEDEHEYPSKGGKEAGVAAITPANELAKLKIDDEHKFETPNHYRDSNQRSPATMEDLEAIARDKIDQVRKFRGQWNAGAREAQRWMNAS